MKRWACALAAIVALSAHAEETVAMAGKPAPMFRLPVYNGAALNIAFSGLDQFVGRDAADKKTRLVLLSFMASFCAPCKKELPYLQSLHEKYGSQGLRVLSVSIDTEPEGQAIVEQMIAQNKITYPVLKDRFKLVAMRWLGKSSALPSVFLVNPDGKVAAVHKGYGDDMATLIDKEIARALDGETKH